MGVILKVLEPDKSFEVEFPREDGSHYGDKTFIISIDEILVESLI
jgi:hypothetical protein